MGSLRSFPVALAAFVAFGLSAACPRAPTTTAVDGALPAASAASATPSVAVSPAPRHNGSRDYEIVWNHGPRLS